MRRHASFFRAALPVLALLAAVGGTYLHSLDAPYVLDDIAAIERNASIRDLRDLGAVLQPPAERGVTVGGRPVLNLSFAVNRAALGHRPEAYRAVNVAIHAGCVLLAFGLLRRLGRRMAARTAGLADSTGSPSPRELGQPQSVAFAVALLWAVHPVNTAAVTYLSQRAESLASCFYLLAVYAFVRAAGAGGPPAVHQTVCRWSVVSVVACLLGVATKEIVVTEPLVILLLDGWFFAGSFRAAWRARRGLYLALGTSWILAAFLMTGAASRGGTIGFATPISPWAYLGTQVYAIAHYLRLAAWPTPLVFDHGTFVASARELAIPAVTLLVLGAITAWGWRKRNPLGLAGVIFIALLAPTSSVIPIASQTVAEHRLYLPLLVLLATVGFGAAVLPGRRWLLAGLLTASVGFGVLTWQRNALFRDEAALWRHTTAHQPGNARGWNNLGVALTRAQQPTEAIAAFERATALQPAFAEAHNNAGYLLLRLGRPAEALPHLERAVSLSSDAPDILGTYAAALFRVGQVEAAAGAYRRALAGAPKDAELEFGLANVELQLGRTTEALARYERALQEAPDRTDVRYNLGLAQLKAGQPPKALQAFEAVLRADPAHMPARLERANVLDHLGRLDEAAREYEAVLTRHPESAAARAGLERINVQTRRGQP